MSDDRKINEFLRKKTQPCPPAPRDEYQKILSRLEKESSSFHLSWKWMTAFGAGLAMIVLLVTVLPLTQNKISNQAYVENNVHEEEWLQETFSDYASSLDEEETL